MSICSVMAVNLILHYRHQCTVILGLQHSVENYTDQFSFRIFDPCSRCLCDQLTGKRLMFAAVIFVILHFLVMLKSIQLNTYLFYNKVLKILQRLLAEWCVSDIITHAGPSRYQPSLDRFLNTIKNQLRASHRYTNPQLFKIYFFCFACVLSLMYLWCVCCSSNIISFFYLLKFFNQAL